MIPWWMWVVGLLGLVSAVLAWSFTRTPPEDEGTASRADRQWWR